MLQFARVAALAAATVLVPFLQTPSIADTSAELPTPDHLVVVMMENHSFHQIMDAGSQAPFIRELAVRGASFINAFAITHPSEPNYFALFSGSTQNVRDDASHSFDAPTLAGALAKAGKSFLGFIEDGSPRKHNPWESFADSQNVERPLTAFPVDFARLPTVAFVIPGLENDMHDGSMKTGDAWLSSHLGAYAGWAITHNSLLVITFDEDDDGIENRIPTIIFGDHVKPGQYAQRINHYTVLRTILTMCGLAPIANAGGEALITGIWSRDETVGPTAGVAPAPRS